MARTGLFVFWSINQFAKKGDTIEVGLREDGSQEFGTAPEDNWYPALRLTKKLQAELNTSDLYAQDLMEISRKFSDNPDNRVGRKLFFSVNFNKKRASNREIKELEDLAFEYRLTITDTKNADIVQLRDMGVQLAGIRR
jgi:hypothetical protein